MPGALAYAPDGSTARIFMHTTPGAYNDEILMDVLRQVRGKVTLIWGPPELPTAAGR